VEPILTLAQVYGGAGAAKTAAIEQAGQIVFHSVGDTGSAAGPITQSLVADKMVTDFTEANPADIPSFFYHLGDVVYYFGEATYYYDQLYEPYRSYIAKRSLPIWQMIVEVPGSLGGFGNGNTLFLRFFITTVMPLGLGNSKSPDKCWSPDSYPGLPAVDPAKCFRWP